MDFFDKVYRSTPPPWDIGRPQPAIIGLEESGRIAGKVLDVGCGTGENALFLAGRGHETWGVDFAPTAIDRAREKSRERGVPVRFEVQNALELADLPERFDTAIDSGLFHTFLDPHRPIYAGQLRAVLRPGGRCYLMCFSEKEPNWGGPRRVTREEIRATFSDPWTVVSIDPATFATTDPSISGHAWLATLENGSPRARARHAKGSRNSTRPPKGSRA